MRMVRYLSKTFLFLLIVCIELLGGNAMANSDIELANPASIFQGDEKLVDLGTAILSDDQGRIKAIIEQAPGLLNANGAKKISPLMFATLNQRTRAIEILVRLGANSYQLTSKSANLGSPIGFALRATKGQDLLAVMLKAGAPIEGGVDGSEAPLIFSAIMLPSDVRLKQLIAAGANLDVANSVQSTPLMEAIDSLQYEKAELLLYNGANPFLGRFNPLRLLLEKHDKWAAGSPNDLARKRLIAKLRSMGMTDAAVMKHAPTRDELRQNGQASQ